MLKHIGKHNSRKIVIVFREVPGEDHMCLVAYPEVLPRLIHDELMKCVESAPAQNTKDFADVAFRTIMADGRELLQSMHREGYLKKVPCNQVIVTPTTNASVRLDELNAILKKMEMGEEAVRELAELDKNRGLVGGKKRREPREVGMPERAEPVSTAAPLDAVLSDADLSKQRIAQAEMMERNARELLAEAARLKEEAASLLPPPVEAPANVGRKTKKTTTRTKQEA